MFLALGIGVLLGVAIGEEGIVSDASRDLEKSLRGDLDQARGRATPTCAATLRSGATTSAQTYPALVGDLLPGLAGRDRRDGQAARRLRLAQIEDAVEPGRRQVESSR